MGSSFGSLELEFSGMLGIGGSKLELDEKSWFMGSSFGSLELELDTPELMLTSLGQTGAPELPLGAPELPLGVPLVVPGLGIRDKRP